MSSKPITATSSGTRMPRSCSTRIAPSAIESLKATTRRNSSPDARAARIASAPSARCQLPTFDDEFLAIRHPGRGERLLVAGEAQPGRADHLVLVRAEGEDPLACPSEIMCSVAAREPATFCMVTWSAGPLKMRSPSSTSGVGMSRSCCVLLAEREHAEQDAVDHPHARDRAALRARAPGCRRSAGSSRPGHASAAARITASASSAK